MKFFFVYMIFQRFYPSIRQIFIFFTFFLEKGKKTVKKERYRREMVAL